MRNICRNTGRIFLVGCLFAVATQAQGEGLLKYLDDFKQAKTDGKATTVLNIDNDTLMFNRHDGLYTGGLRISQQYALRDAKQLTSYGWRIGQDMYTASDIKILPANIAPNDHPYAGWLYDGFYKETYRSDGTHNKVGLDVGCMGPCSGAEKTQITFHRWLNQPKPQGWSTQMKTEVGAVVYGDVAPVSWKPASWADLTPNFHGRFGNIFTDACGGATLRVGSLPALPDQPTLHALMRVDATAVAYNAMLQGGYFSRNNPRTVTPKRWVGEAELGLVWGSNPYSVSASVIRRSTEIAGLSNATGAMNYVRLVFSYTP